VIEQTLMSVRKNSNNVIMSVNVNRLTERIKMSDVKNKYVDKMGYLYNLVYKGDVLAVLTDSKDGREIIVDLDCLSTHFFPYTEQMQKQQKKNEDLGVLANVTDEIRKLLDDNYVICHVSANRDTKGLVEYTIMLGESV